MEVESYIAKWLTKLEQSYGCCSNELRDCVPPCSCLISRCCFIRTHFFVLRRWERISCHPGQASRVPLPWFEPGRAQAPKGFSPSLPIYHGLLSPKQLC